jgi:hypothetical protein
MNKDKSRTAATYPIVEQALAAQLSSIYGRYLILNLALPRR